MDLKKIVLVKPGECTITIEGQSSVLVNYAKKVGFEEKKEEAPVPAEPMADAPAPVEEPKVEEEEKPKAKKSKK